NAYFQVLEFENQTARAEWWAENSKEVEANTFTIHKKYPFLLLNIGVKKEISMEKLIKIGNLASDWYAQFWLRNKKLSKPKFHGKKGLEKASEYFKHWVLGDNDLDPEN